MTDDIRIDLLEDQLKRASNDLTPAEYNAIADDLQRARECNGDVDQAMAKILLISNVRKSLAAPAQIRAAVKLELDAHKVNCTRADALEAAVAALKARSTPFIRRSSSLKIPIPFLGKTIEVNGGAAYFALILMVLIGFSYVNGRVRHADLNGLRHEISKMTSGSNSLARAHD